MRGMVAEDLLGPLVKPLPAISIPDLVAAAGLQTRCDRKYFVPTATFRDLVQLMSGDLMALDIDGRRVFDYESVYFDTDDLLTYRAHLQRRRRRCKIRTRSYLDSGDCLLELKLKGSRSQTIKHRQPYPFPDRHRLTTAAESYLRRQIGAAYQLEPPTDLAAVLTTHYRRATLTCRHEPARLTCDVGLVCSTEGDPPGRTLRARDGYVLVESKAGAAGSLADRMLRQLGVRPAQVSKYSVAVAGLHPEQPSNPWHRTLRRYFDAPLDGSGLRAAA